jgi:hypothetical protein
MVGVDGLAQHPVRPQDVLLSHEFIEGPGAHALGQRGRLAGPLLPAVLK